MSKLACDNGAKGGCGCDCGNEDPYAQGVDAVWHDPTAYNILVHGPDYLPKLIDEPEHEDEEPIPRQASYSYDRR